MVVKMVYKFMAVVAMMVIGMTVSSCDRLDNPVRYAEDLGITTEKCEYLNKDRQIEIMVGTTVHLIIVMDHYWTPTKATFSWSSSDPSVVTVDENGILKAVGMGTALITAQWTEDPSRQATIAVFVKDYGQSDTIDIDDDEVSQDEAQAPKL